MQKKIIALIIIIYLLLAAVLFAYYSNGENNTSEENKLSFNLIDTNNISYNEKSVKNKYLIINYWATWCTPCLKEIPILVDFYKENSNQVEILGLNYDDDEKLAYEFQNDLNINYPIILNNEQNSKYYSQFIDLQVLPTTLIYSKKGDLMHTFMGEISKEDLTTFITLE